MKEITVLRRRKFRGFALPSIPWILEDVVHLVIDQRFQTSASTRAMRESSNIQQPMKVIVIILVPRYLHQLPNGIPRNPQHLNSKATVNHGVIYVGHCINDLSLIW